MGIETAEFVKSSTRLEEFCDDGRPEVAFVGRSNVGKSSLMNRLVGRTVARTSSTPGRTRMINWFSTNRGWLVDLPGFGYARASKTERQAWAEVIGQYFTRDFERIVPIQLVDAKVGATDLDRGAIDWLRSLGRMPVVVATKVDKLKRGERARALERIRQALRLERESDLLAVSSETGEGVRELRKRIEEFLAAG